MKGPEGAWVDLCKDLSERVIDACFIVHRTLGPGFPEKCYEEALCRELDEMNIAYKRQHSFKVEYKGKPLSKTFRVDIMVEEQIIVEVKSVTEILPVHEAQVLAYLRAADKNLGYVINFNVALLKNGIRRKKMGFD